MENARTMKRGDEKAACIPQAGPVIYSAAEIMWVIRPETDNQGNQCLFLCAVFPFTNLSVQSLIQPWIMQWSDTMELAYKWICMIHNPCRLTHMDFSTPWYK